MGERRGRTGEEGRGTERGMGRKVGKRGGRKGREEGLTQPRDEGEHLCDDRRKIAEGVKQREGRVAHRRDINS